jgi:hypothetical protein
VLRYLSGVPFTVQDTTLDNDRNGVLFEPLPAGSYNGTCPATGACNLFPVDNAGGRNGAYGPSFFQWDARVGYRFKLGGARSLEAFGEVFNLTDRANFANPTGDRFSANFLRLTALRAGGIPRTFQFGTRFAF